MIQRITAGLRGVITVKYNLRPGYIKSYTTLAISTITMPGVRLDYSI